MAKKKLGLVQVYTGEGKGKTTLALGIALRAIGQNCRVRIIQFLKGGAYTGEFLAFKNFLPQLNITQFGKPCVKEKQQLKLTGWGNGSAEPDFIREDVECGDCRECFLADNEEKVLTFEAFQQAKEATSSGEYDLVILDEINYAINKGLLDVQEVIDLIKEKDSHTELVLTGRSARQEILDLADLVTRMDEVKHPFQKGIPARRAIEY